LLRGEGDGRITRAEKLEEASPAVLNGGAAVVGRRHVGTLVLEGSALGGPFGEHDVGRERRVLEPEAVAQLMGDRDGNLVDGEVRPSGEHERYVPRVCVVTINERKTLELGW